MILYDEHCMQDLSTPSQSSEPTSEVLTSKKYLELMRRKKVFDAKTGPKDNSTDQTPDRDTSGWLDVVEPEMRSSKVAPGYIKPQPEYSILEWTAPSRLFKKRTTQFFSTVLIIGLLLCLILFFINQFLPIAVVVAGVFLTYVLAIVPPELLAIKLTTYGVRIDSSLYEWSELGRFWFSQKYGQLMVHFELFKFPGRLTLLLDKKIEQQVTEVLSEVLMFEQPPKTQFEKIAQWLEKRIQFD